MAKYIGKRIVPVHCGVWEQNRSYEMLSIVLDEASGDSYISRRAVPSGTALKDMTYWMLHSLYSQQIQDMSDHVTAAEARIKADNDATKTHIDNAIDNARADLNDKWTRADADMKNLKAQYEQTSSSLSIRMDNIVAGSADGSDMEVADAKVDSKGYSHDTLGATLRDVDKRTGIALAETAAIDHALTHNGVVVLDTGEWVFGTIKPDTGEIDDASTQVIRTKDYHRFPASTMFKLDGDFRIRINEYRQEGGAFVFVNGQNWMSRQGDFRFDPDSWYVLALFSSELKANVSLVHKEKLTLTCAYLAEDRNTLDKHDARIGELENNLDSFKGLVTEKLYGILDTSFAGFEVLDYYFSATDGSLTEIHRTGLNYRTYLMKAPEDFDCFFDELPSSYTSISVYNSAVYDADHFIQRYRHNSEDDNLPARDNQLHVSKGMGIAISIYQEQDFHLYLNLSDFGYKLGPIQLSDSQMNEIESMVDDKLKKSQKHSMLRYSSEGTGKDHTTERLDIYIPTVIGYLYYEFGHCVSETDNADNWRICYLYSVDDNLNRRYGVTQRGEWEMAITLKNRPDFIGGILHGDEVLKNIAVYVDGRKTALKDLTKLTQFTVLRIVEQTELFDPNDGAIHVADHGKEYTFNGEELHLRQTVNWLIDEELGKSYMLMFPVYRGNDEAIDLQVTDHFYANDDFTEYDVSIGGDYNTGGYGWRENVTRATIYSDKSGFCGTCEMIEQPALRGGGSFMVQRTLNAYNKMYWSIAGRSEEASVNAGDRWYVHSMYQFSVAEGTDVK